MRHANWTRRFEILRRDWLQNSGEAGSRPSPLRFFHRQNGHRNDPTGHAEILAIRAAAAQLGHVRLLSCTLYTTVEPCFMCAGALSHARVERVVFGVRDPKFGGCVSLGAVLTDPRLNHRAALAEGVRADEARELLQRFFRARRAAANRSPRSPRSSERCQSG